MSYALSNSKWRFSLASLMFLIACWAGFLSGYRVGHDKGAAAWNSLPVHVRVYDVADVLANAPGDIQPNLPTADELIASIKNEVLPKTWIGAGGNGEIRIMPEETRLVVAAHSLTHEELADYLDRLRRFTSP